MAASSTSIEGYEVSADDALALTSGEVEPQGDEDRSAVADYARAMDHVAVLAADPAFTWSERVILDLHFDTCYFQPEKRPGAWRDGPIGVSTPEGRLAYEGLPADQVPDLMREVAAWLEGGDRKTPAVVRGAMAHLHLVSVHPFADGNGRVARILQSLVLAREGLVAPELGSIEEHLAENTSAYYEVLRRVQGGSFRPDRDATKWLEFCIHAHLDQARRRLAQISEAAVRWEVLEGIVEDRRWPDRLVIALERSLIGGVDRGGYASEADISFPTASGDLRRLTDAGLVAAWGAGRNTRYLATKDLRERVERAVRERA